MSRLCFQIRVCRGGVCAGQRGADRVHRRLHDLLGQEIADGTITLERHSCFGRCTWGANVYIRRSDPSPAMGPRAVLYSHVEEDDAEAIVDEHVRAGRVLRRLIGPPATAAPSTGD